MRHLEKLAMRLLIRSLAGELGFEPDPSKELEKNEKTCGNRSLRRKKGVVVGKPPL